MSSNNARKKAARRKQAENPGMSYQKAWDEVGAEHKQAIIEHDLAELGQSAAQLEEMLAAMDAASARATERAQQRFHDHVVARFDGNGALTALDIDAAVLYSYTTKELGRAVTDVMQRTWDAVMAAAKEEYAALGYDIPLDRARDAAGVFTEASRDGALKLAVNGAGRLLWCEIGDEILAGGWTAAEVSERIMILFQSAVMRSWREIGRPLDEPTPDDDRDRIIPSDAEIARYRAETLTF
ncbi:hypothetical protein H7I77_25205 [Mycolicibacterium novocastrense]|uniref:Uncharacterized protein n=1 Tax=Mycolicibacterium novocastrense TaxID=59813 RepID=A0AAW5SSP8_MYCNV|nr:MULTISPECIES: hypothetical protein [Mycolicibacterium]MCV7026610.1 hypothetical protein [Mycolicibacterium novocastrense]MDX1887482.1 hypothetical protein [Mycolicibacterium sp. 120270]GAT07639.1 putative uncharacterized protein [Mycolicibacterium novocastrense]